MNELVPDVKVDVPTPEQLIGRHVRLLRQEHGWSQQEVAEKMRAFGYQWSQATVTRLESASRPIRVNELADLAALFGVHVTRLLDSEDIYTSDDPEALEREVDLLAAKRAAIREHLDHQIAAAEEAARGRAAVARHLASIDARLDVLRQRVPRFEEIARGRAPDWRAR